MSTVPLLRRYSYETSPLAVRETQKGFVAIVQHSLPTSQEPQCIDAEGARTFLPRFLKVAKLRAEGKDSDEMKRFIADLISSCLNLASSVRTSFLPEHPELPILLPAEGSQLA